MIIRKRLRVGVAKVAVPACCEFPVSSIKKRWTRLVVVTGAESLIVTFNVVFFFSKKKTTSSLRAGGISIPSSMAHFLQAMTHEEVYVKAVRRGYVVRIGAMRPVTFATQ